LPDLTMEIELKFQVPAAVAARLRRAVATRSAQTTHLQAIYVETPDDRLCAAGLALRLRKEGRVWVQTLKGSGDGLLERLEHEVPLPAQRGAPALDLARHDGTPAGARLRAVLADGPPPEALYRTDIQRLHRVARHGRARVEIAFDEGWLIAGDRRVAVCEIEFELLAGTSAALVDLAARWAKRYGLWWDVRSKAERGLRLARGAWQVPATRARVSDLSPEASPHEAWVTMLQATLTQALPNAAELAGPYSYAADSDDIDAAARAAAVEHVHQLRVSLRRLRSVLSVFAGWDGDAAAAAMLQQAWREPFVQLGATRDADVLAGGILTALADAGAPALAPTTLVDESPAPGAIVRDPAFTALLLRTLALVVEPVTPPPLSGTDPGAVRPPQALHRAGAAVLASAWRPLRRDLKRFASLPLAKQHRVRRRLKRLRYAWEFLQPLWPGRPGRRWHKALCRVLDVLGHYNDLCIASASFEKQTASDPRAWFACGWLAAQRPLVVQSAADALHDLVALPKPWKRARRTAKGARR